MMDKSKLKIGMEFHHNTNHRIKVVTGFTPNGKAIASPKEFPDREFIIEDSDFVYCTPLPEITKDELRLGTRLKRRDSNDKYLFKCFTPGGNAVVENISADSEEIIIPIQNLIDDYFIVSQPDNKTKKTRWII